MRVAFFSDVHACLAALDAVLDGIQSAGISRKICLGDIVGYGAEPSECASRIRDACDVVLLGNHDAMMVAENFDLHGLPPAVATPLELARKELSPSLREWLADLPLVWREAEFEACHANLADPGVFAHMDATRKGVVERHFARQSTAACFFGHIHRTGILHPISSGKIRELQGGESVTLEASGRCAVAVGSVAFSRGTDPRPSWVEFDTQSRKLTFHRVEFGWAETLAAMRRKFGPDHELPPLA